MPGHVEPQWLDLHEIGLLGTPRSLLSLPRIAPLSSTFVAFARSSKVGQVGQVGQLRSVLGAAGW